MTAGIVTFHPVSTAQSKVMLKMEYDPTGIVENVGDACPEALRPLGR